jgi:Predicted ATPase
MSHAVFLCHSAQDREEADAVCAALEAAGVPCWVPSRDVAQGAERGAAIVRALHEARLLLLLLTAGANDSPRVLREVEQAVALGVPLLTVRREAVTLSEGLGHFLRVSHWLDVAGAFPRSAWLPELVGLVRRLLPDNGKSPPVAAARQQPGGAQHTPANLPLRSGGFVGRDDERTLLAELLADPSNPSRLVTVTGMGGIGKTRLALEVAHGLRSMSPPPFPDGIFWADLTSVSEPALVAPVVAQVMQVAEPTNEDDTLEAALRAAIGDRRLLIVLDNCEHLLTACAVLAASILRECARVRIVATSRERLGINGERVHMLSPLPVGGKEDCRESTAVRLFALRARAVQEDFAVTDANAEAVAEICRRLDGIPLAIELAAARARVLTPQQIAGRLEERFGLLTDGNRDLPPHQQTLRALIDWSYDLLTPQERALLQRVSVFMGGWTLEAAEEVCSADGALERWEMVDLLLALVEKSLVVFEGDRYRLLDTVRAYAADRLAQTGGSVAAAARHAAYFLALAEKAAPELRGPNQALWLERLATESSNLRAAHAHAALEPREALRLAAALHWFWHIRGRFREGLDVLSRSLAACTDPTPTAARGTALHGAGLLASELGKNAEARRWYGDALTVRRALGDTASEATTLNNLGVVALAEHDLPVARELIGQAVRLYKASGREELLSGPLSNLALVATLQGDFAEARSLAEQGLAVAEARGERHRIVELQVVAAFALMGVGDLATGRAYVEEALRSAQELGYLWYVREALMVGSALERWAGNFAAARRCLEEAEGAERELDPAGAPSAEWWVERGDLARAEGDRSTAAAAYARALDIAAQEKIHETRLMSLFESCALLIAGSEREDAARLLGHAGAIRARRGMPVPPVACPSLVRLRTELRRELGDAAFLALTAEGERLDKEQGIALARGLCGH